MDRLCLIIPTVRNYAFLEYYIQNAISSRFDKDRLYVLLITEDHAEKDKMRNMISALGLEGGVFGKRERNSWLAAHGIDEFSDLIPNLSHAETSFGLLFMWKQGFEYGCFIDDDTGPLTGTDFFGMHLRNLNFKGPIPVVSSDKAWVNVLYQNFKRHGLYPRGYPYSAMGETIHVSNLGVGNIVGSQGLWTGVPDLDAVRILAQGNLNGLSSIRTVPSDFTSNFCVAKENFTTISSMNFAFRREIIPAFYQLPMDDNEFSIGRFDDIWSGIFLKKASDTLGRQIICGFPLCQHMKAPRNIFRDLLLEAPGLEINEHLWRIVEAIDDSGCKDYSQAYGCYADCLAQDKSSLINSSFIALMGKKMQRWLKCLLRLE